MIAPIVEALRSCNNVSTEMLVNVDSPGDNQVSSQVIVSRHSLSCCDAELQGWSIRENDFRMCCFKWHRLTVIHFICPDYICICRNSILISLSQYFQVWTDLAHNSSGWVIPVFSSNVHEIRSYNRLAGMARGKVMIILQVGAHRHGCSAPPPLSHLLIPSFLPSNHSVPITHSFPPSQDDEVPPSGCVWLRDVLTIFGAYPRLGAVGLKIYQLNKVRREVCVGRERQTS